VPAASSTRTRGRRATRPSGDDREAAILRTLEDMLEHRPFTDISVDDLAKGAGLSRPTFYFYFASKDDVLVRLFARAIAASGSEHRQPSDTVTEHPQRAWHDGIFAFFDSLRAHRTVVLAGVAAMATNAELRQMWSTYMTGWIDYTAALITKERERGAAPDSIPARDLATALNLMNERVLLASQGSQKPTLPEDAAMTALAHVWIASIYGGTTLPAASV
jgi:TetR/AcrR family transcriptional regulator, ethionamide resistance regulator